MLIVLGGSDFIPVFVHIGGNFRIFNRTKCHENHLFLVFIYLFGFLRGLLWWTLGPFPHNTG